MKKRINTISKEFELLESHLGEERDEQYINI